MSRLTYNDIDLDMYDISLVLKKENINHLKERRGGGENNVEKPSHKRRTSSLNSINKNKTHNKQP